eukprot:TRINITY_DN13630_c0_g1_i1.p1 TRINITY_DN13630_c0_g1~~TRINITY_DN13630_c0_g1_i1.p1  ORF type:complete len:337 (-),score=140.06 TRINITY_DN13630_c0_g1_i1:277-1287(-)
MVQFLVGAAKIGGSVKSTWDTVVSNALAPNQAGDSGKNLTIERDKFRYGNLDSLMLINDQLAKLDLTMESLLKRIEKQYSELETKKELNVATNTGNLAPQRYVNEFKWDDSKFPRNKQFAEILKLLHMRMEDVDKLFKSSVQSYIDTKNQAQQLQKKEGGTLVTRDLSEILRGKIVSDTDFVESQYLTTLIAVVHKNNTQGWLEKYEFLTNYVVPRSSKQFQYEDKDGFTLWRVIVYKSQAQDFINEAKLKLKLTVREFKYEPKAYEEREAKLKELEGQTKLLSTRLIQACEKYFSELYIIYIHMKVKKSDFFERLEKELILRSSDSSSTVPCASE